MVLTRKQRAKQSQDKNVEKTNQTSRPQNKVKEAMEIDWSDSNDSKSEKFSGSETDGKSDDIPNEIVRNPNSSIVQRHANGDQIRMLLICPNGEQRLITFDTPVEECTVKDLLDEAGIPIVDGLGIFKVKEPELKLDYIIRYVFETDSMSEEDNNKRNNVNVDKAGTTKANTSSGFFSSWGRNNCGDSVTSGNEISEKRIREGNDLVELEEVRSERIGMRRRRKRRIVDRKPHVKDLASLYDASSDEEDRKTRSSENDEIGRGVPYDSRATGCDSSIETAHTFLICNTIMIGSHNYTPEERVIISRSGVKMKAPHLKDHTSSVVLELKFQDIVKVLIHFGENISALFFYVKSKAGEMFCGCLGMEDAGGPYYKPSSRDDTQRLLTLVLGKITAESKLVLKSLFTPNDLLAEITSKETEQLLSSVSPKNILPQIKSLLKIPGRTKTRATLKKTHTVEEEVQMPMKKDKSLNQISEEIELAFDFTLSEEIENPLFKRPRSPLKRSKGSTVPVNNSVVNESQCLLVYPPSPGKGGIAITAQDLACLEEGRFLNDIIIDFYLMYLTLEVLSKEDRDRTYIFSIHFYKKLTTHKMPDSSSDTGLALASERFSNVKKWTKNVDIFEKDFVIVPINEHAHWFLAIICFPALVAKAQSDSTADAACEATEMQCCTRRKAKEMKMKDVSSENKTKIKKLPCILVFDSLAGPRSRAQSVIRNLREYLSFEYTAKVGEGLVFSEALIEGACPKVPQQNNFSDCGLYVLQYVESFFSDPIMDYTLPIKTLENWFDEVVVNRKRRQLLNSLKELQTR